MDIWLMRAGHKNNKSQKFIKENCIYLTFVGFSEDINKYNSIEKLQEEVDKVYSDTKTGPLRRRSVIKWSKQIWAFKHDMKINDWVAILNKSSDALAVGKIRSDYLFVPEGPDPFFHQRSVDWIETEIPRALLVDDLRSMSNRFMILCKAKGDDLNALLNK